MSFWDFLESQENSLEGIGLENLSPQAVLCIHSFLEMNYDTLRDENYNEIIDDEANYKKLISDFFGLFKKDNERKIHFFYPHVVLLDISLLKYIVMIRKQLQSIQLIGLAVIKKEQVKYLYAFENLRSLSGIYFNVGKEFDFSMKFLDKLTQLNVGFHDVSDNIIKNFKKMKNMKDLEIRIEEENYLDEELNIISNVPTTIKYTLSMGDGMEYSGIPYDNYLLLKNHEINKNLRALILKWVTKLTPNQFKSLSRNYVSLSYLLFEKSIVSKAVIYLFDSPSLQKLLFERTTFSQDTLSQILDEKNEFGVTLANPNTKIKTLYFFSVSDQEHRFTRFSKNDFTALLQKCINLEILIINRCGLEDQHVNEISKQISESTTPTKLRKIDIEENPNLSSKSVMNLTRTLLSKEKVEKEEIKCKEVLSCYVFDDWEFDTIWKTKLTARYIQLILSFFLLEHSKNNIKSVLDYYGYFERDHTRKIFLIFDNVVEFSLYDLKEMILPVQHVKSLFFGSPFSSSQRDVPFGFISKCKCLETLVSVSFHSYQEKGNWELLDECDNLRVFETLKMLDIKIDQFNDTKIRVFNKFKNLNYLKIEIYGKLDEEHLMLENKVLFDLPSIEVLDMYLRYGGTKSFLPEFSHLISVSEKLENVRIQAFGKKLSRSDILKFADSKSLRKLNLSSIDLDIPSFCELLLPKIEILETNTSVLQLEENPQLFDESIQKLVRMNEGNEERFYDDFQLRKLVVDNDGFSLPDSFVGLICGVKKFEKLGVIQLTEHQYIKLKEKQLVGERKNYSVV